MISEILINNDKNGRTLDNNSSAGREMGKEEKVRVIS